MSFKISARIDGMKDFNKLMNSVLPAQAKKKTVQTAMLKSVKEIRNNIRGQYKGLDGSGALAASVGAWRVKKGGGRQTFASIEIGPKRSSKRAIRLYFAFYGRTVTAAAFLNGIRHGHLVEFGYSGRRGRVSGKKILTKAAQAGFGITITNFRKNWGKEIDKAAANHHAKTKGRRR